MFREKEKSFQETETAFAVAVILLNVSVLAAAFSIGWLAYWLVMQSSRVEFFLRVVQPN